MRTIDWEIVGVLIALFGGVMTTVFQIGVLYAKMRANSEQIKKIEEVVSDLNREVKETEELFFSYENTARNIQIRLINLEEWSESKGYRRVRTKTDFE
ncbi:hypothetical protein [Okeania sp. SIO2B3]|uniref:hypothetical protein n=1 Tax=Okeania sp. SIO2B3 TaxID=2607784 RepID=UPI0013C114E9|nr:hypothetical protein [Okeania sp. SIO2B3]NET40614.1 hypothetical protein [Okeania sp. SIO2B3]